MLQPLIPFNVPLEGESELSWGYFQHYRDLGREQTKTAFNNTMNGKPSYNSGNSNNIPKGQLADNRKYQKCKT